MPFLSNGREVHDYGRCNTMNYNSERTDRTYVFNVERIPPKTVHLNILAKGVTLTFNKRLPNTIKHLFIYGNDSTSLVTTNDILPEYLVTFSFDYGYIDSNLKDELMNSEIENLRLPQYDCLPESVTTIINPHSINNISMQIKTLIGSEFNLKLFPNVEKIIGSMIIVDEPIELIKLREIVHMENPTDIMYYSGCAPADLDKNTKKASITINLTNDVPFAFPQLKIMKLNIVCKISQLEESLKKCVSLEYLVINSEIEMNLDLRFLPFDCLVKTNDKITILDDSIV